MPETAIQTILDIALARGSVAERFPTQGMAKSRRFAFYSLRRHQKKRGESPYENIQAILEPIGNEWQLTFMRTDRVLEGLKLFDPETGETIVP